MGVAWAPVCAWHDPRHLPLRPSICSYENRLRPVFAFGRSLGHHPKQDVGLRAGRRDRGGEQRQRPPPLSRRHGLSELGTTRLAKSDQGRCISEFLRIASRFGHSFQSDWLPVALERLSLARATPSQRIQSSARIIQTDNTTHEPPWT